jgi:hypothetical protein
MKTFNGPFRRVAEADCASFQFPMRVRFRAIKNTGAIGRTMQLCFGSRRAHSLNREHGNATCRRSGQHVARLSRYRWRGWDIAVKAEVREQPNRRRLHAQHYGFVA